MIRIQMSNYETGELIHESEGANRFEAISQLLCLISKSGVEDEPTLVKDLLSTIGEALESEDDKADNFDFSDPESAIEIKVTEEKDGEQ